MVRRVALCGGAGDAFISEALSSGADVYVTSDLRHHPAQDARESATAIGSDLALIDISHWAAESLWLDVAAKELEKALPGVKFEVSDLRTDPWDFAVTQ
jgi:putative NIF3 family GTP cyclohydrolase 1 type 2